MVTNEVDDFSLLEKSIVESNTVDGEKCWLRAFFQRSSIEVTKFHFKESRSRLNAEAIPRRISKTSRRIQTKPREDVAILPDERASTEVKQRNYISYEFRCVFML